MPAVVQGVAGGRVRLSLLVGCGAGTFSGVGPTGVEPGAEDGASGGTSDGPAAPDGGPADRPQDAAPPASDGNRADRPGQSDGPSADLEPAPVDAVFTSGNPCPPAGSPCRIMPLGDSITYGYPYMDGGYRLPLFRLIQAAHQSFTFVGSLSNGPATVDGLPFPQQHEGHQGWVIMQIDDLVKTVLPTYRPHIITLMIGTNDIASGFDRPNAPARVAALVDKMSNMLPDSLIVVAQIVPTTGDNANVQSFNAGLRPLIESRAQAGKHVLLVDMYGEFTANPRFRTELMYDGLHPSTAGYSVMANLWYRAISGALH